MYKVFKFTVLICFLSYGLFAENNQTTGSATRTVQSKNLPSATGSTNSKNMNIVDWENLSKQQGIDESLSGVAQDYARKAYGSTSLTSDLNNITDTAVQSSTSYDTNLTSSLKAYTSEIQSTIMGNATSGTSVSASASNQQIKCFIARDIPFRYKCSITGLIYGGDMDESGANAKRLCTSECYETNTCMNVTPDTIASATQAVADTVLVIDSNETKSKTFTTDGTRKIKNITFATSSDNTKYPFYLTISYKNSSNVLQKIVSNLRVASAYEERIFTVNDNASEITFNIDPKTNYSANVSLTKISVNYLSNEKWICPSLQDISDENPANFAKLCPSGKIYTFTKGSTYKICADSAIIGENSDGTFASQSSCLTSCKKSGKCTADTTTFNTESLKNFREGCIQGQANCKDSDCVLARKIASPVINEVFFDAGNIPIISIQNSIQIKDVERPRVSANDDEDYLLKQADEWKDKAYTNMLKEKTFNLTGVKIGENTNTTNAFGIGVNSGSSYGVANTSVRSLKWNFKPAAYDVSSNESFYMYAIVVADIGKKVKTESASDRVQRDRIWYIKTSSSAEQYKPFYREVDIGGSGIDNNASGGVSFYEYTFAEKDYQTFSGSSWYTIGSAQNAEYFSTVVFTPDLKPFWTVDAISNVGGILTNLPGLIRSRTKDFYQKPIYTGNFDGTGDGLLDIRVIPFYTKELLTYAQIYEKIQNKEYKPIYQSTAQYLYPTSVASDAQDDTSSTVHVYQYGRSDKQTAYMRVFPKNTDIGKKGFIYVFIY